MGIYFTPPMTSSPDSRWERHPFPGHALNPTIEMEAIILYAPCVQGEAEYSGGHNPVAGWPLQDTHRPPDRALSFKQHLKVVWNGRPAFSGGVRHTISSPLPRPGHILASKINRSVRPNWHYAAIA